MNWNGFLLHTCFMFFFFCFHCQILAKNRGDGDPWCSLIGWGSWPWCESKSEWEVPKPSVVGEDVLRFDQKWWNMSPALDYTVWIGIQSIFLWGFLSQRSQFELSSRAACKGSGVIARSDFEVLQVLSQVENDAITTAFLHEQCLGMSGLFMKWELPAGCLLWWPRF